MATYKIYQMSIKLIKVKKCAKRFHSKFFQNIYQKIPKLAFLVCKCTIWFSQVVNCYVIISTKNQLGSRLEDFLQFHLVTLTGTKSRATKAPVSLTSKTQFNAT
jgi:hypothetical protein